MSAATQHDEGPMMSTMTTRYEIAKAGPSDTFAEICKALYGEDIDPETVWDEIIKLSPDQADTHARNRLRTNLERGSNAVGFTAGLLATGSALRDDRFKDGGKVAQALHRRAKKIPTPISNIGGRKGALIAGGALGVQGLNIVGDAAIAQSYANRERKAKRKAAKAGVQKGVGSLIPKRLLPKPEAIIRGTKKAQTPHWSENAPAAAGRAAGKFVSTKTGKAVLGAGAVYGGAKVAGALRSSAVPEPDPYYYGKAHSEADITFEGTFSKLDDDQRLAFGWASVTQLGGSPVVDRQGDYIDTEEIEKAAYEYVHKSRVGGDMHKRNGEAAHKVSDLVESIVFTDDKVAKMGLPDDFPRGWWVGFKIHDEATWGLVKKGERTGFSIHGKGLRKDVELDEVMGYRT